MKNWSALLTQVFLHGSTLVTLAFILCYHFLARWEKSSIGRHLMIFSLINFLVLFQVSLTLVYGHYPGAKFFKPLAYASFFFVWLWRLIIFLRDNRAARKEGVREISTTTIRS